MNFAISSAGLCAHSQLPSVSAGATPDDWSQTGACAWAVHAAAATPCDVLVLPLVDELLESLLQGVAEVLVPLKGLRHDVIHGRLHCQQRCDHLAVLHQHGTRSCGQLHSMQHMAPS